MTYEEPAEEVSNLGGGRRAAHVHEDHGGRAFLASAVLRDGRDNSGHVLVLRGGILGDLGRRCSP